MPYPSYRHPSPHYRTPGRSVVLLGAAAASTTVYVNDTFTRTGTVLGTADTGQVWTDHFTTWETNGSEALNTGATNPSGEALNAGQSNCYTKAILSVAANEYGVCGRCPSTDPSNDGFHLIFLTATSVLLRKRIAGVNTNLGTFTIPAWANGDSLGIRFNGTTITAYHNDVSVGSATDADMQSNTYHGLVHYTPTATVRYASFTVTS